MSHETEYGEDVSTEIVVHEPVPAVRYWKSAEYIPAERALTVYVDKRELVKAIQKANERETRKSRTSGS